MTPIRFLRGRLLPAVLLIILLMHGSLFAIPRFSLLTGTRCSACHVNPQGGGVRNDLGWLMMNETGAVDYDDLGLEFMKAEDNRIGPVTVGLDARVQMAKIGRPPFDSRLVFPMQISPYVALQPFDELWAYGGYNIATTKYRFQGQTEWNAALLYQPSITLPSVRVGYIQPSIGVRHDDHTVFVRSEAGRNRLPVVPIDYHDWGAEFTYEGLHWLTANAGVFSTGNLSEVQAGVDSSSVSYLVRAMFWPQLLEQGINGELGASMFGSGDFSMINIFAGAGLADVATLYGEVMLSDDGSGRTLTNMTVIGSYQLAEWLALEGRYERGQTKDGQGTAVANSYIIGAQFFPIPYLEIRPEYRYYRNDAYIQAQYTLQFHMFY